MAEQHDIQTATMARIYTQQGHYRKAAEIYRHLLGNDPSRQDLAEALAEVESMQAAGARSGKKDLAPLLREWIRLAVCYRQVQQLRRMKNNLSSIKTDGVSEY
ncbi:MAG: hypothetical protein AMJ54_11325 [Deltaproteobacteria bacterium SG8_13]|nr:MAG: hypothetical protein AMJ54_11325 [Deltaproteobacteria bacterium SG8_13]